MTVPKIRRPQKARAVGLAGLLNDAFTALDDAVRASGGGSALFESLLRKTARAAAEKMASEIPPPPTASQPAGAVAWYMECLTRSGMVDPGAAAASDGDVSRARVVWDSGACPCKTYCAALAGGADSRVCVQRLYTEQAVALLAKKPFSSRLVGTFDGVSCAFEIFASEEAARSGEASPCAAFGSRPLEGELEKEVWSKLEAQYQLLLETIADAIVVVDNHKKVTYVNPRACGVFGIPPEKAVGAVFEPGGPLGRIGDLCLRAADDLGKWEGIQTIENRDGERIHNIYLTRFSPIFSRDRVRIGTMIVLEDITREEMLHRKLAAQTENLERIVKEKTRELQEANAKLEILARTDPLTGLANRRTFEEVLRTELLRAGRYKHSTGVLMVDVDEFKQVNDRLGHQVGDIVLKYVASILSKSVRASDTVARWGGDEFILLLPQAGTSECTAVARRISENLLIENASFEAVPGLIIGLSVGWATDTGGDADALIARADQVMYDKKAAKKTRVRRNA